MSLPPEVLLVSPVFPSPALPLHGVAESPLLTLLAASGFSPRVVVPLPLLRSPLHGAVRHIPATEHVGGCTIEHPRYIGVPRTLTARGYAKCFEIWGFRRAVRRSMRSSRSPTRPRILHAHTCVTAGYALLALRGHAPLVVTVHDSDLQTSAGRPRLRRYVASALGRCDHVVYQSRKLLRLGEALVGRHPCSVIPWGVHTYEDIAPRSPETFTVVAVARLVPTKGLDLLVRAFKGVLDEVPGARLEIVGGGSQRDQLQALIRSLGLEGAARLTGWLPNRVARERVAAASAFVLPSYEEALGAAYLEAMSVGVPAVGVIGQGIAEVIQDGRDGLLVPPRDVGALRATMLRLARDPDWARALGEAGRRTFLEGRFDWRGHAERHAALYDDLMAMRASPVS